MTTGTESRTDDVQGAVLDFLRARTGAEWDAERDLFAEGGLSSLFAMELVVHLEQLFDVEIAGSDLRLDNFRTVRAMTALVDRLRAGGAGG
ncbi:MULTISPECIES: acyl carrier protein [Actinosynnema]|uniref:acyl carrier protein n=1 Tax=Actinosynnema TaxID=40566 RepID=UPI0020A3C778|nr:acyl carrier protein [Actinosynnema pretiosum]MCP2097554.1 methoxymalonate biosynthesis acyl carrier protein [Actinosynnema pretiosum]